jgi:hypothetical protein
VIVGVRTLHRIAEQDDEPGAGSDVGEPAGGPWMEEVVRARLAREVRREREEGPVIVLVDPRGDLPVHEPVRKVDLLSGSMADPLERREIFEERCRPGLLGARNDEVRAGAQWRTGQTPVGRVKVPRAANQETLRSQFAEGLVHGFRRADDRHRLSRTWQRSIS